MLKGIIGDVRARGGPTAENHTMFRPVARLALPVFGALLLAAPLAQAACPYPKAPSALPDGATASKDEMMAGKAACRMISE